MIMDRIQQNSQFNHDLPHEHTMDLLGLELEDLNANLRGKVRRIDDLLAKALSDGYVDDNEEKELIQKSYKLSLEIESTYRNNTGNGTAVVTLLGGLGLIIGAAIGIKQLSK